MPDTEITPEVIKEHGITPEEYEHILEILGREPNFTELGIFSVMWSEHCSYKNTRALLKTFPTRSPKVIVAAGEENAGVIDMGDGLGVAFKIESHNHPSAVEPFQGAATGVGGIVLGSVAPWQAALVGAQTLSIVGALALLEAGARRRAAERDEA